ncbi:LHFPL tetraspan subfamily member 2a protein [Halotydeus destructor]|nr:LHFPL tetraspan subfamily member 2a protein [Halotydeus destructor]
MMAAIVTPMWLIGLPRTPGQKSYGLSNGSKVAGEDKFSPTLGIYNRCTKVHQFDRLYTDSCAPFATSLMVPSDRFPLFWKVSLTMFTTGLVVMVVTITMSLIGSCVRSIGRKSIFNISGTLQAVAGLFFLLGLLMYPAGWGSKRVKLVCGPDADPFWPGDCQLGWAVYLAIGSILATFVCSVLSLQAESSTSTDKVQDEILEGKTLICLF